MQRVLVKVLRRRGLELPRVLAGYRQKVPRIMALLLQGREPRAVVCWERVAPLLRPVGCRQKVLRIMGLEREGPQVGYPQKALLIMAPPARETLICPACSVRAVNR